ncbi:MAG TPA: LPS export ABC transporter periplasmic protein LptC [bacterium]|nr:LPS export ABC transporter periplasmic protein LptC [bacterium]
MRARLLVAVVLLLGGAAGVVLWLRPVPVPAPAAGGPPQISLGLREGAIVLRHKGVKQAEIRARRVIVSADLHYARLTDIARATIYDKGTPAFELAAREIVMDRRTSDLEIQGPVVVTTTQGYELTAPAARWHHARQQVVFPRGVRITRGPDEIRAGSLVIDGALQTFDLSGGVDITFRLGEAPP